MQNIKSLAYTVSAYELSDGQADKQRSEANIFFLLKTELHAQAFSKNIIYPELYKLWLYKLQFQGQIELHNSNLQ